MSTTPFLRLSPHTCGKKATSEHRSKLSTLCRIEPLCTSLLEIGHQRCDRLRLLGIIAVEVVTMNSALQLSECSGSGSLNGVAVNEQIQLKEGEKKKKNSHSELAVFRIYLAPDSTSPIIGKDGSPGPG